MRDAVLAVDVGGTRIKAAWLGDDGRSHAEWTSPTPVAAQGDDTVARIVEFVVEALAQPPAEIRPVAIGMAVPGAVDEDRGFAIHSENLGWRDRDFAGLVRARTSLPFTLSQDVRAGARAELATGAAQGMLSALFVPIGTGIGGAVIVDGEVRSGPNNRAGELGHVRVGVETDPCLCGQTGCLEAIASAVALRRQYTERTGQTKDVVDIVELAESGDTDARHVWQRAIDALATALSGADQLLDLQMVVVGGGVSLAGSRLIDPLRDCLRERGSSNVIVTTAHHGDRAGSIGAGLRAWALLA